MANTIEVEVVLESKEAEKGIKNFTKGTVKFEKQAVKSFSNAGRAFDVFKGTLATAAVTKSFELLAGAARGLFNTFLVDGVKAAQVQEDAINEMNVSLVRSGEFSDEASQSIQAWASALQQTTIVGDETTLSMFALAKSFGFSAEQAKVAVQAALELSAAAGISLEEATRRVGRTISGSTADVAKFAPEIANLTKEELEAGKAAEALVKALGGTAAAQINTFSGSTTQLGNTFGDLQEAFGGIITGNKLIVDGIKLLNQAFNNAIEFVKSNEEAIKSFVNQGIIVLVDAFSLGLTATDVFARGFQIAFNIITAAASAFALGVLTPLALVEAGIGKLIEAIPGLSAKFGEGSTAIQDIVSTLSAQVQTDLDDIANAATRTTVLGDAALQISEFSDQLTMSINTQTEAIDLNAQSAENAAARKIAAANASAEREKKLIEETSVAAEEARLIAEEQDLLTQEKDFEFLQERLGTEAAIKEQAAITAEKDDDKRLKKRVASRNKALKAERDAEAKQVDFTKLTNQEKLQAAQTTSGLLVQLTAATGSKNTKIGKALAITDATIAGILGVQKALASGPFPVNVINASIVGALAAINVNKIRSAQPPSFQAGGIVGGTDFTGDNVSARVNSGEAILTRQQQTSLFNAIDRDELSGGGAPSVTIQGNVIGNESFAQEIVEMINDAKEFRNADVRF